MKVYVAECGVYAESYVSGVYATAELAMEAHADPADKWTQDEDGDWDNGQDMGAAVRIYGIDLTMSDDQATTIFHLSRASNGLVIPEPPPVPDAIEHGEKFEGTNWAIGIPDLDALLAFAGRVGPIEVHAPSQLHEGRPSITIADE